MQYHKTVSQIKEILEQNSCWFEFFEHEPVRTSEEAAKLRTGYTLKQGAKAMIARVRGALGKKFVMFVIPANQRLDMKKIKQYLGYTDIRFAGEDEVEQLTGGVLPGGVPPFGNLFNLEVMADPSLFANEKIVFNAGDRRASIAMLSTDFKKLVEPIIVDIT